MSTTSSTTKVYQVDKVAILLSANNSINLNDDIVVLDRGGVRVILDKKAGLVTISCRRFSYISVIDLTMTNNTWEKISDILEEKMDGFIKIQSSSLINHNKPVFISNGDKVVVVFSNSKSEVGTVVCAITNSNKEDPTHIMIKFEDGVIRKIRQDRIVKL